MLTARILIVDDTALNIMLLERLLGRAGYTAVESTMDPGDVCTLQEARPYDLIILDLQMPKMDGFAVMKALAGTGAAPPILVTSAEPGHKRAALEAGAAAFLSKPISIKETLQQIQNILAGNSRAKGQSV